MKTPLLFTVLAVGTSLSFGQTEATLDENNVSFKIYDNGFWFNDSINSVHAYEVPKGSNKHVIYGGGFWFGGFDINGQTKLVAQQFPGNGHDFFAGAGLRIEGDAQERAEAAAYFGQTVWTVSKAEVDNHIANYQSGGYVMPNDIANWPAHGDTSIGDHGMLPYIAPFVDVNNNGTYDPSNGDYPCIKGDKATYTIMNDVGIHTASGGEPMYIEVHTMFYQFSTVPGLEDVTFIDIEVVNLGTQTIYDSRAAFFLDSDIGNYNDDFVGTDVQRKMVYTYNGDANDETNGGALGYGTTPPALGLMTLSHSMDYSISYSNGAVFPQIDPTNAFDYYYAMNGLFVDGSPQLDGQGDTTNYFYTGDPNVSNSWSEYQLGNMPGDRRMVTSADVGTLTPDFSVGAGQRLQLTYAIVYAEGADHLSSVVELQTLADYVQSFYNIYTTNCTDFSLAGLSETEELEVSIFPNPNNGAFTLRLDNAMDGKARIFDHMGRVVFESSVIGGETLLQTQLSSGIYHLEFTSENSFGTTKFVVR